MSNNYGVDKHSKRSEYVWTLEEEKQNIEQKAMMPKKVYVVLESGYYNEEYWDVYTNVVRVYGSKEKAENYINSLEGIIWDEECESWKIGDEDTDAYNVRFYDIEEADVIND